MSVIDNRTELVLESGMRIAFSGYSDGVTPVQIGPDGVMHVDKGAVIRVVSTGSAPRSDFSVFVFSDPVKLGFGTASASGTIDQKYALPGSLKSGTHHVQLNSFNSTNQMTSISVAIEVAGEGRNISGVVLLVVFSALGVAVMLPAAGRRRRART